MLQWISDYFNMLEMYVSIKDKPRQIYIHNVTSPVASVPQDSVLGPPPPQFFSVILSVLQDSEPPQFFQLYMNDICNVVKYF